MTRFELMEFKLTIKILFGRGIFQEHLTTSAYVLSSYIIVVFANEN